MNTRRCGVLIHPTSFPSPFGIGDFGQEARDILTMLANAKVSLWQILPLGPTGYGASPYSALSTFAGNELLIDLRSLDGMFGIGWPYRDPENDTRGRVNYGRVEQRKVPLLLEAASLFINGEAPKEGYKAFCKANAWWLDDYALYRSLVAYYNDSRWQLWEPDLKLRKKTALAKWTKQLSHEIEIFKVLQYFFFEQWNALHKFANDLGIRII
ncbi:MAG: 4-alpha-glucanotransferase, partial [Spirochaetales bacterium]|nr:4-alpha-glucanotransferase [Spirochaetales bacterium]